MKCVREEVVRKVESLDASCHRELFSIVQTLSDKFTRNNNGIFLNLRLLNDDDIFKLNAHIDELCAKNEVIEEVLDATIDDGEGLSDADIEQDICEMTSDSSSGLLVNKEHQERIVTTFDTLFNKTNKKQAHNKFSLVKKKYNKPVAIEYVYKRNEESDLNELLKEEYILV